MEILMLLRGAKESASRCALSSTSWKAEQSCRPEIAAAGRPWRTYLSDLRGLTTWKLTTPFLQRGDPDLAAVCRLHQFRDAGEATHLKPGSREGL